MKVAVVSKDRSLAESLARTVRECRYETCLSSELLSALKEEPSLIFCEWQEGPQLAKLVHEIKTAIAQQDPVPIVALVSSGGVPAMRRARALGVTDVLFCPPEPEEVKAELEIIADPSDHDTVDRTVLQRLLEESLVGESDLFRKCLQELKKAARCDANVLLVGETGTGKEMVARAIHILSPRSGQPYLAVNCASLPGTLLESELFGHARGAFTGAQTARLGRFEVVGAGTLVLDEVGDMEPSLQVKLLRVIEQREFQRVGENTSQKFNGRLICATSVNLEQAAESGKFRRDLLGRIDQFRIALPALRERKVDISILIRHFLRKHGQGRQVEMSRTAADLLASYDFPMNIRQLENAVVGALVRSNPSRLVLPQHLPEEILAPPPTSFESASQTLRVPQSMSYKDARAFVCREIDRIYLAPLLMKHNGSQVRAAEEAGIDRNTFGERIKDTQSRSDGRPDSS